eukprot:NODE_224_length_12322_cov_0.795549.p4 type:complete len:263 gc:universal NODE_224_length_12322_cov_0.795549:5375-6163(+)
MVNSLVMLIFGIGIWGSQIVLLVQGISSLHAVKQAKMPLLLGLVSGFIYSTLFTAVNYLNMENTLLLTVISVSTYFISISCCSFIYAHSIAGLSNWRYAWVINKLPWLFMLILIPCLVLNCILFASTDRIALELYMTVLLINCFLFLTVGELFMYGVLLMEVYLTKKSKKLKADYLNESIVAIITLMIIAIFVMISQYCLVDLFGIILGFSAIFKLSLMITFYDELIHKIHKVNQSDRNDSYDQSYNHPHGHQLRDLLDLEA